MECAGAQAKGPRRSRVTLCTVVDPRPTAGANPASYRSPAIRGARDGAQFDPFKRERLALDNEGHRECAAGRVLALGAVAGIDQTWLRAEFVAKCPAWAAAGLGKFHCITRSSPRRKYILHRFGQERQ